MSYRTLFNANASLFRPTSSRSRSGGVTRTFSMVGGVENISFPCRISTATPSERMVGDTKFAEATGVIYLPPAIDVQRGDEIRGGLGDNTVTLDVSDSATSVELFAIEDGGQRAFNLIPQSLTITDAGSGRVLYDVPTFYPGDVLVQGAIVEDITGEALQIIDLSLEELKTQRRGSFTHTPFAGGWNDTTGGNEIDLNYLPCWSILDPSRSYPTPPGMVFTADGGGTITCDFGDIKSTELVVGEGGKVTFYCRGDIDEAGVNEVVVGHDSSDDIITYDIQFASEITGGTPSVSYPAKRGNGISYSGGLAALDWGSAPTGDVTATLTFPSRTYEVLAVRDLERRVRKSHSEAVVRSESREG